MTSLSQGYAIIVITITTCLLSVSGFATDICNHDELVEKSRDGFECGKKFDAKVFGNARNNSGNVRFCQIVKESIEDGCYKKTIGQCANNDVVGEEAITMLTWFFMNNYTRCDKDLKQKEIEEKAQIILAKYSGDYSKLYNLIKYDKPDCSIEERRKAFRTLMPCSIPQILKALSELKYGDNGLESLPACNIINNVLENCFKENQCFSQREMDYGRDLIAGYYINNLNSLRENPGYPQAVKNFLRRFDSKKVLESLTLVTERLTTLIVDNLPIIISDFEADTCQQNMEKYNSLII